MIKRTIRGKIILFLILCLGFGLRIYGLNWDQGFHLHPDERMIIMVTERLKWDSLNPKFFAYGSLPIYLLKSVSSLAALVFSDSKWMSYQYLPFLGRVISAFFDLGVVMLIFKIGKRLFNSKVGLLAAFFYSTCVLPIQLAHFYAVDSVLSFFIWLTIWFLLDFYDKPAVKNAIKIGIGFGIALATKVSATVLVVGIGAALLGDLILVGIKFWRRQKLAVGRKIILIVKKIFTQNNLRIIVKRIFLFGGTIVVITVFTFLVCEPYALIDFKTFRRQTLEQNQMTKNAYVFPYTLQYVGTMPYFYQLKNMILWGMGIALGLVSIISVVLYLVDLVKRILIKGDYDQEAREVIFASFGLAYFLTVGLFAVKFMRYFLPLYPFFIILGAKLLLKIPKTILGLVLILHLSWATLFLSIYSRPHSRVQASEWINNNIPRDSYLAVEHWDDPLPLWGGEKYQFLEMPMYDSDSSSLKWQRVNENLAKADYIVLSSNRLYVPLQKLVDCQKYKVCYPKTTEYYEDLFSGRLSFEKVAEFTSYPGIKIGNWELIINDDTADESFSVYDHPKVTIFLKKKTG